MQRLGCAARDKSLEGKGIIVAEPKYFDDEIEKAAARAEQRKAMYRILANKIYNAIAASPANGRLLHRAHVA